MPIYFPSGVITSNYNISHYTPNFTNTSINLKSNSYDRGIHQIQGSFDAYINTEKDKRLYESFLMQIRGKLLPFYIFPKGRFASPTVISSNVPITAAFSKGSTAITLGTFIGSISEGDVFYVINDTKVYMALNDATSNTTLNFYPPLMKDVPISQFCHFNNVPVLVRMDTDNPSIDYMQAGLIHKTTINFKEEI